MKDDYVRRYANLHERHWWWRARDRAVLGLLERLATERPAEPILDVGCAAGSLLGDLSRFGPVEGMEPREELARQSRWADRIHVRPFDSTFQPQRRYGWILMLDVLEHLPDPVEAMGNVRRLLTDDGCFVATVPAFRLLWTSHDALNDHVDRYSRARFDRLATRTGFHVSHARYLFQWLFGAKLVQRAVEVVVDSKPRPPRVPPEPLNAALYAGSVLEAATIGRLRPPWGSTLLVVARPVSPRGRSVTRSTFPRRRPEGPARVSRSTAGAAPNRPVRTGQRWSPRTRPASRA